MQSWLWLLIKKVGQLFQLGKGQPSQARTRTHLLDNFKVFILSDISGNKRYVSNLWSHNFTV